MMLSLFGFPTVSLQKFWVHDVVQHFPSQILGAMMVSSLVDPQQFLCWIWAYVIDVSAVRKLFLNHAAARIVHAKACKREMVRTRRSDNNKPICDFVYKKLLEPKVCFISQWLRFPGMLLFKTLKSCVPQ